MRAPQPPSLPSEPSSTVGNHFFVVRLFSSSDKKWNFLFMAKTFLNFRVKNFKSGRYSANRWSFNFCKDSEGGAAVVWAKMQLKNGEFESKLLGLMTSELIRACELEHTNWNFHILFHVASQCAKWRPKVITPTRRNFAKMPWTLFVIKTGNQKRIEN